MVIIDSIRRRGFRKWYERELLVGHSHLVLLLLCTLALLGAFEAFSQPGAERLLIVVALLVAAVLGVWALRRYLFLLLRAEQIANQAVCPACKAYGRWQIEHDESLASGNYRLGVCCRKCSHRWRIEW